VRRADHLYRGVVCMSDCYECCVFSGRGLCDGLITCTEESYGCSVCCECFVLSVRGLGDGLITCTEESYGCLSVVIVVCFHVDFCAMGCSHVQRSRMDVFLL